MADIFLKIVNMSISASWIVLGVLLLRLLLKKAPKWINGILWGIVGLRLIMPFSLESVFSLIPSGETISKAPDAPRPHFESGVTIIDNQVNDYLGGHYYEGVTRPTGYFADITTILAIVWIVGIVVLLAYTIISYLRVKNKIGTAVLLRDNIYQSENVVSPFVLGIIKPKIYLPFNMNEQDMNHVIAHENAHIRRKDHWWKPFGFLVLTLHWFNPLMWLGYVLLCRDIELACDEKVVKEFNNEQKADYSQALLTCSVNRRMIAACPLAFGEVGVKNRVKSVLNYKKPAFWIVITSIVASAVVAVCFLTNPQQSVKDILVPNTSWECENYDFTFQMDQNYVIEGNINTTNFNGTISIGFRYAGKKAVAEIFEGNWEYAQSAAEDPLLLGTFYTKSDKLIFEIEKDNIGMKQKELIFCQTELSDTNLSNKIFTDYEGVYITIKSIDKDEGGQNVFGIVWHNETDKEVTYGEMYTVEYKQGEEWLDTDFDEERYFNTIGYVLKKNKTESKNYITEHLDISKSGTYRFLVPFSIKEGDKYVSYKAWAEFKVGDDESSQYSPIIDTATFDIDGDGKDEQCALSAGPTSGLFTFIFSVSENGNLEYFNIFNSPYTELKFIKNAEGKMLLVGKSGEKTCYMGMDISDGNIVLSSDEQEVSYWGEQGLNSPYAPKTASALNNAIAKVLNEKYSAKKPDGLIHVENYYLLSLETASGTPLKGNSGHMKITNVYLLVYHMKYSVNGGQLEEHEGDFVPTAITFSINENGEYTLKEYWTPKNGANYEKDVRSKFPGEAAENALNSEKYAEDLIKESWRIANETFNRIKP